MNDPSKQGHPDCNPDCQECDWTFDCFSGIGRCRKLEIKNRVNNIPTPRTDAAEKRDLIESPDYRPYYICTVNADFARELERELIGAMGRIQILIELGQRLRDADSGEIHEAIEEWDKFIEEMQ